MAPGLPGQGPSPVSIALRHPRGILRQDVPRLDQSPAERSFLVHVRPALLLALGSLAACRTSQPAPAVETRPSPGLVAVPAEPSPLDESALDHTVSPCDDFYQFACGGWLARTEIPPDKPMWSRGFTEVHERNLQKLRGILESAAAGAPDTADPYWKKIGDFYAACMDEAGADAHGLVDLKAEWARLDQVSDAASLEREVAFLHARGVFSLFGFGQTQDAKNANEVIAEVAQGGLSLPDRDYYTKPDPRTQEIRALYRHHVERMLVLAGISHAEAQARAAAILRLETALAEPQWTQVQLRDPARVYNRVDLAGLEKLAPRFGWKAYLADVGIPGVTSITVTTPRFLERMNALVETTPAADWRAYLEWHLLEEMARARALPKVFVEQNFAFAAAAFTGQKEMEVRWKRCVSETDAELGEALGEPYVHLYFGAEGKERTSQLVAQIEKAMGEDLQAISWMDAPTRQMALLKLSRIVNKIGYPNVWRNYDALLVDRSSFFKSVLAANAFEVRRQLAKIGKPVDRKEWQMTPPAVNAYYDPQLNEMVFPAGILQPPFFGRGAPQTVNYGSIGMVVGHELTHGFDDEGRKFDADGNLRDWWTPTVAKEFDRRAQCLVKQFDAYEPLPGVRLNGELTLGENIADLGGTKLSFAAMRRSLSGEPPPPSVGGFTPHQQFFVGLAQVWCTQVREPFARMLAAVDPHSPPRFRVNGPLSNLHEFAEAFQCQAGSRMARPPDRRCAVW
jgi:putative endopeptidase